MVGYWATAGAVSNSLNKVKHGSTTLFWAGNLHAFFLLQTSQIDEAVKQLDNESRDVLMKYIYRSDLFKLLTCYFRLLQLQLINRLLVPIYPDRFTMFDVLQSEYQRLLW